MMESVLNMRITLGEAYSYEERTYLVNPVRRLLRNQQKKAEMRMSEPTPDERLR